MDTTPYVIEQGDYLIKLAVRFNFDAEAVWSLPANAHLKASGRTPNLLYPGDVLYVPEPKKQWLAGKVGGDAKFKATVVKTPLCLAFKDATGKPLKALSCIYEGVVGTPHELPPATDGEGKLKLKVPVHQAPFVVEFPSVQLRFTVSVAHLDPISEKSGISQRLAHLGYEPGPIHQLAISLGYHDADSDSYKQAQIAAFQVDQGLTATGEMDPATEKALTDLHGC